MKINAATPYGDVVAIVGFVCTSWGIQAITVNKYGVLDRYNYNDLTVIDKSYKP